MAKILAKAIEEKLEEVSRRTVMIDAVTEQVSKRVKTELPILFSRAESLDTMIGTRVKSDVEGCVPPTVWSSIAQLTTLLHKTELCISDILQLTGAIKKELYQELLPIAEQKASAETVNLKRNLKDLKSVLATSIQQIADRFQQESVHVNDLRARVMDISQRQNNAAVSGGPSVSPSYVRKYVGSQVDVVHGIMMVMDRKINDLIAETNQDAVKFNSFGFRRAEEANAWI
jgi:hypothetical protein